MLPHRWSISAPQETGENRRRRGRVRCNDLTCDLGRVLDISASGMLIATDRKPPATGTLLVFAVHGPEGPVPVRALVRRCHRVGRHHQVGMQFVGLSLAAAQQLAVIARMAATMTETLRG